MVDNLLYCQTNLWVLHQEAFEEIFCFRCHLFEHLIRDKIEWHFHCFRDDDLLVLVVEWSAHGEQLVHEAAESPNVDRQTVGLVF